MFVQLRLFNLDPAHALFVPVDWARWELLEAASMGSLQICASVLRQSRARTGELYE